MKINMHFLSCEKSAEYNKRNQEKNETEKKNPKNRQF